MFSVKQQLKTLVILINFSSLTIQKCKYLHCSQKEPQEEVFTFRNMNAATKIVIGLAAIIILAGFGLLLDPLSMPNGELRTTKKETTLGNAKATIDEHTFQRSPSRRRNSYRAPSEENVMHACREHFQLNESELNLHLQARGYSLASLLTALRLSGNLDYLRQASERFPGQPEISMELALRSESPEERREAIDALRRTDPGKGFADYLSAHEHYLAGDTASALRDFLTAGSKDYIDYPMDPVLKGAEQAYLDNGYSPLEAKVASALSLPAPPIDKLAINAAKMADWADVLRKQGDAQTADLLLNSGVSLGKKMQKEAFGLLEKLSGLSIEQKFLANLPSDQLVGPSQTASQRREEISTVSKQLGKNATATAPHFEYHALLVERNRLRKLHPSTVLPTGQLVSNRLSAIEVSIANLPENFVPMSHHDMFDYFATSRTHGESEAIQSLIRKTDRTRNDRSGRPPGSAK